MIVNSQNIEFGYELISALPYAYYLHSIGELEKTISGNDTECLYYFSPNHEINPKTRSWYNTPKAIKIPNIDIHKPFLKKEQFLAPPLKEHYANSKFKFGKETVIICNRYNLEWGKQPINYFSLATLSKLFKLLQDKYQIIYINVDGVPELYDNAPPMRLGDYELLKKFPKVINIHDLKNKHKEYSFNELQLMLFANCEKYITMNGGHSILASYFGGENIIMSKYGTPQAREISKGINSFYRWYHEFGGQRVRHVPNENELIKMAYQWIKSDPVVNILVRTSFRPNYFKRCMNSILNQTYKNVNIFVSTDKNDKYIIDYPVYPVDIKPIGKIEPSPNGDEYGIKFSYNLYLNDLQDKVTNGLIIYLDDDDVLSDAKSLELIVNEYKKGNELIFWKIKSSERVIPNNKNWGKAPVCCDISGISFAFDSKYKKFAKWEPYKRGDYRVATKLYKKIKKIKYIDKILSQTQDGQNAGGKRDYTYVQLKCQGWYITKNGGYWYGDNSIGKKKTLRGEMKRLDISEVPEHLINKL